MEEYNAAVVLPGFWILFTSSMFMAFLGLLLTGHKGRYYLGYKMVRLEAASVLMVLSLLTPYGISFTYL